MREKTYCGFLTAVNIIISLTAMLKQWLVTLEPSVFVLSLDFFILSTHAHTVEQECGESEQKRPDSSCLDKGKMTEMWGNKSDLAARLNTDTAACNLSPICRVIYYSNS